MKISSKDIPKIKPFRPIDFPAYSKINLENGIPVYYINTEDYDVIKIEINYKAGRVFEKQKGLARACAHQMKEGAGQFHSEEIARTIDFFGATLNTSGGMDFARVELYALNKHLRDLLPVLVEILNNPHFSQDELTNYIQRNVQRLAIDLSKNDIVAYRLLTECIFGKEHPYGYNSDFDTLNDLSTNSLRDHFKDNYKNGPESIILAGRIDLKTRDLLEEFFGKLKVKRDFTEHTLETPVLSTPRINLPGEQKYQSSIRLGRKLFNRSNPDYPAIYVLNTILGGFFGSRLMNNLREDKGLTYDIFSSLDMFWKDGYLMIGAEVDDDNVSLTLDEIYREFEVLKTQLVPKDELELVRNYINGNLLNLMNGPFNSIELIRLIAIYDQNLAFFDNFMEQILKINPLQIQNTAIKYLNIEDFTEVIVGG